MDGATHLPRQPKLKFLQPLARRVELVGPGVQVQKEGGSNGDNQKPFQVSPARHAIDEDLLHRDSRLADSYPYPAPHA